MHCNISTVRAEAQLGHGNGAHQSSQNVLGGRWPHHLISLMQDTGPRGKQHKGVRQDPRLFHLYIHIPFTIQYDGSQQHRLRELSPAKRLENPQLLYSHLRLLRAEPETCI